MLTDTELTFSLAGTPYLEFLPVIDLSDGRLLGMEALVRWEHPTEGLISPDQLIPEAEASGDIGPLTRWVVMEACRQAGRWSPSIQLGVNGTIHQLRRGEVSKAVADALEGTGFPSGQLTLEVTEDAIVDPTASEDLMSISRMGVQLSVDDVGTNWSSFEPFKRHSISTVKIDGSFIAGLEPTQGINRLVVETVIHMAHSLGMSALAERVETMTQVEIVRSFGADAAQGFFFARPMSSEDAAALAGRDEVAHFSRCSKRMLVRRVDGTVVEEPYDPSVVGPAAVDTGVEESTAGIGDGRGGSEVGESAVVLRDDVALDEHGIGAEGPRDVDAEGEGFGPLPDDDSADVPIPGGLTGRKRQKSRSSR